MRKMTIDQLLKITQGVLLRQAKRTHSIRSISTDTRQIAPGSLFIALVGQKLDGHDYIGQAVEKGAVAVCISDETKIAEGDFTIILVKDTLKAYQSIAAAMREEQGYTVVGVTGSVGKTSTREMIAAALSIGIPVHQTKENFNNEIGLSKTLLEMPEETSVCIVEMGMRGPGEIRELTKIARPDIAVITNIGMMHIERLGNQDEIFKAKTEIVEGLKENGLLVFNANDPYLSIYGSQMAQKYRTAAVMVGEEVPVTAEFTVRGYGMEQTPDSVTFQVEIKSFQGIPIFLNDVMIPVPGEHNVSNALVGIAVAIELELNLLDVIKGLSGYQAVGNRQRIIEYQNMTIIDDSYNAGPESMRAAITMLSVIAGDRRKIAVLGGMLELGDYASAAHEEIGRVCVEQKVDRVFACGDEAKSIQKGIVKALSQGSDNHPQTDDCPKIFAFTTRDELIKGLLEEVRRQDVLLIKGSRGFQMEKVTQALLEMKLAM